jgi:hypothetical protein
MERDEVRDGEAEIAEDRCGRAAEPSGDSAGNLYWRGRRITAADYAKVSLVALLVGIVFNLVRTVLDIGSAADWW